MQWSLLPVEALVMKSVGLKMVFKWLENHRQVFISQEALIRFTGTSTNHHPPRAGRLGFPLNFVGVGQGDWREEGQGRN